MGGHQVVTQGPNDDGFDEDGFDESQRAEILEATRGGPGDGTIQTDLSPDLGGDAMGEDEDDVVAEEDAADIDHPDAADDTLQP